MPSIELFTTIGEHQPNSDTFWEEITNRLYTDLPLGGEDGILPPHFVKATFPKIGGKIIWQALSDSKYWGFLMPTRGEYNYVLRFHSVGGNKQATELSKHQITNFLASLGINKVFQFDVSNKRTESFNGKSVDKFGDIEIRHPSNVEAKAAQDLHRKVWNIRDLAFLYPFDLYHPESGLATRLVATHHKSVVGFLFGFYGIGTQWFGPERGIQTNTWVESQLLGVDQNFRHIKIAQRLKLTQRELALQEGINLIHWTVDPLQSANAFLNLNSLGGLAAQFYPDYYVFRNDLNRVPASRIGISWILDSPRAIMCSQGEKLNYGFHNLSNNSSAEVISPVSLSEYDLQVWSPQGETILIEIPHDWDAIQKDNLEFAKIWRSSSDKVFNKLIGRNNNYILCGICRDIITHTPYLIAKKPPF